MPDQGRVPPPLRLCRACRQFVKPVSPRCDLCDADLDRADREYAQRLHAALQAADRLRELLRRDDSTLG